MKENQVHKKNHATINLIVLKMLRGSIVLMQQTTPTAAKDFGNVSKTTPFPRCPCELIWCSRWRKTGDFRSNSPGTMWLGENGNNLLTASGNPFKDNVGKEVLISVTGIPKAGF